MTDKKPGMRLEDQDGKPTAEIIRNLKALIDAGQGDMPVFFTDSKGHERSAPATVAYDHLRRFAQEELGLPLDAALEGSEPMSDLVREGLKTPLDDLVRDMEKLIDEGRGDEHVSLTLPDGHPPLEGKALKVYAQLADLKIKYLEKTVAAADVAKRIYVEKMLAYNRRSLAALKDGELTPEAQKTLSQLAQNAVDLRQEMMKDPDRKRLFAREIKEVDAQIAEIASMVHEPLDQSAGAGKAHGLNAKPDAVMKEVMFNDIEDRARKAKTAMADYIIEDGAPMVDVLSQMKELIAAGQGDRIVRVTMADGDTEPVTATALEVCRFTIGTLHDSTRRDLNEARGILARFQSGEGFLHPDAENLTPAQREAAEQGTLMALASRILGLRQDLFRLASGEFAGEIKELDGILAGVTSMVHEPLDQSAGAGKIRVLDEKRLARDENEIRDLPLREKIARKVEEMKGGSLHEVNQHTWEMVQQITGKPMIKVVEEIMDEQFPDLMRAFYPRIYENTGRYASPRSCAAMIANVVAEMLRYGFHRSATAYRLLTPGLSYLRERRMPMFFLAPDLLEAVLRTDFDDDINWTELSLPYETGVLILPKGALVHPEDGEMSMLIWSRVAAGEHPAPWPGLPKPQLPFNAFIILGACPERMMWYDSILTADVRPIMRLNNLFYRDPGQPVPAVKKSNFMDADLTEEDSGFVEKMGVIVFGTILAMNARPQLVEHGKLIKRVAKADKIREFWSPNVIGAKYKFKREVPQVVKGKFVHAPGRETGTHASPRMHWRRGHYRNQPVGPGRKERKNIWIEPCLIGAE